MARQAHLSLSEINLKYRSINLNEIMNDFKSTFIDRPNTCPLGLTEKYIEFWVAQETDHPDKFPTELIQIQWMHIYMHIHCPFMCLDSKTRPLNANINDLFTILIESIDLASDKMTGDCQKIKWKSISSNRNYLRIIKKCMPQFLEPMPWKVQLDSFTDEIIFKLELAQFELARHDHEILNQGHFE